MNIIDKMNNSKAGATTKGLSFFVAIILFLSAIPLLVGAEEPNIIKEIITKSFEFSPPTIEPDGDYVQLHIEGADQYTAQAGTPLLPACNGVIKLPFGTTEIDVDFTILSDIVSLDFEGLIAPSPTPLPLTDQQYPLITKIVEKLGKLFDKQTVYGKQELKVAALDDEAYSSDPFGTYFDYNIYVGRDPSDTQHDLVTYVVYRVNPFIFTSVVESQGKYFTNAVVTVTYDEGETPVQTLDSDEGPYDFLIFSPSGYLRDLTPLVEHKEDMGLSTKLVSLDDIYNEVYFDLSETYKRDDPEKIKYFMYQAVMEWDVEYVMAVGGWRTFLGFDVASRQFPIRFSNNADDNELRYSTEQYYSCFLRYNENTKEYVFDTWDSNGNDIFAEWNFEGYDIYDPVPDVHFGRLACRNRHEVRTMVDKIIYYETNTYESDWFDTMLSVTGDGFQDIGYQTNNSILWDITGVQDGDYIIYAQSHLTNDPSIIGPIDQVTVTVDKDAKTRLTFTEDDHLWEAPLDEDQETKYPMKPISEIVVPGVDGCILGNSDVNYNPKEAYGSDILKWGEVKYINNILYIKTKSYDPAPHAFHDGTVQGWRLGSKTKLTVWINNSDGETIDGFPTTKSSEVYWEGEMEGEQAIIYANGGDFNGDQIDDGPFEVNRVWTSNGKWFTMSDVLEAFSEGYGLAYINGHANCMVYGDHLPGIPGGRDDGQITGLATINMQYGLERYQSSEGDPLLPLDTLTNGHKLPVLLYSGCHSGQFDTSFASLFYDPYNVLFGDRYATWTPEGVAWWITRLPQGGSIATIANSGVGSGYPGAGILDGYTGWIFPRFFYNYNGGEDSHHTPSPHLEILGEIYTQTLIDYVTGVPPAGGDLNSDKGVRKHFEQWNLLGDPTLKIGGYPPDTESISDDKIKTIADFIALEEVTVEIQDINNEFIQPLNGDDHQVTFNEAMDTNPEAFIANKDGGFLVGYTYETPKIGDIHPGFASSVGGVVWDEFIYATSVDSGHSFVHTFTDDEGNEYAVGTMCFGPRSFGGIVMGDIINPYTWSSPRWGWTNADVYSGQYGCAVTGYLDDGGTVQWGGIWTGAPGEDWGVHGMFNEGDGVYRIAQGSPSSFRHFAGDCDQSTNTHYYVCQDSSKVYITIATPPDSFQTISVTGAPSSPDVAARDGWAYVVYEINNEIVIKIYNDASWSTYTVTIDGEKPEILIAENGDLECYYIRSGSVYKSVSDDHGQTWEEAGMVGTTTEIDTSIESPFQIIQKGLVFDKGNGDLYANLLTPTKKAVITDIIGTRSSVKAKVTNSGTEYLVDATWTITVEGISPLGEFFGSTPFLLWLFQGRVFSGTSTEGIIMLESGQNDTINSGPMRGLGHVMITITISDEGEVLTQRAEDGFLLGGRLFLMYPEG